MELKSETSLNEKHTGSFSIFCEQLQEQVKFTAPDMNDEEIAEFLAKQWEMLSEEEKSCYVANISSETKMDSVQSVDKTEDCVGSFEIFVKTLKHEVKESKPDMKDDEIERFLLAQWETLNDELKSCYTKSNFKQNVEQPSSKEISGAYLMFHRKLSSQIKRTRPSLSEVEIDEFLASQWEELSEKEKLCYELLAKEKEKSGFNVFFIKLVGHVRHAQPHLSDDEVNKFLSAQWEELSADLKACYEAQAISVEKNQLNSEQEANEASTPNDFNSEVISTLFHSSPERISEKRPREGELCNEPHVEIKKSRWDSPRTSKSVKKDQLNLNPSSILVRQEGLVSHVSGKQKQVDLQSLPISTKQEQLVLHTPSVSVEQQQPVSHSPSVSGEQQQHVSHTPAVSVEQQLVLQAPCTTTNQKWLISQPSPILEKQQLLALQSPYVLPENEQLVSQSMSVKPKQLSMYAQIPVVSAEQPQIVLQPTLTPSEQVQLVKQSPSVATQQVKLVTQSPSVATQQVQLVTQFPTKQEQGLVLSPSVPAKQGQLVLQVPSVLAQQEQLVSQAPFASSKQERSVAQVLYVPANQTQTVSYTSPVSGKQEHLVEQGPPKPVKQFVLQVPSVSGKQNKILLQGSPLFAKQGQMMAPSLSVKQQKPLLQATSGSSMEERLVSQGSSVSTKQGQLVFLSPNKADSINKLTTIQKFERIQRLLDFDITKKSELNVAGKILKKFGKCLLHYRKQNIQNQLVKSHENGENVPANKNAKKEMESLNKILALIKGTMNFPYKT